MYVCMYVYMYVYMYVCMYGIFCTLVHDYTLCFTGFPYCNVSYYNYISILLFTSVVQSHTPKDHIFCSR